jgi:hypothetical protein
VIPSADAEAAAEAGVPDGPGSGATGPVLALFRRLPFDDEPPAGD